MVKTASDPTQLSVVIVRYLWVFLEMSGKYPECWLMAFWQFSKNGQKSSVNRQKLHY